MYKRQALNTVNINWRQRARQLEKGFSFEQRYTSLTYKPVEKSSDYLNEMKEAKEDVTCLLYTSLFDNFPPWIIQNHGAVPASVVW